MSRVVTAAKIIVIDNQVESALKALKKQMLKDGMFQEMKRRVAYEKPSVKRKRKQAAARKKRRKAMRRLQQRCKTVAVRYERLDCLRDLLTILRSIAVRFSASDDGVEELDLSAHECGKVFVQAIVSKN
jgi:small subunit ribosomal protein S21